MRPNNRNEHFIDQVFGKLANMAKTPAPPPKAPDIPIFDFDALHSNEEVWRSVNGEGGFSLVFQNERLHLVYEDLLEGIERAHELTDDEMTCIMHLLIQFRSWTRS